MNHPVAGYCIPLCLRVRSCLGNVSTQALYTLPRQVDTNQRIGFDIDPTGRYLATGSTERRALVYDIESQTLVGTLEDQPDAVGNVCFHPHAALLGVCTGQRHFDLDTDSGSDTDVSVEDATQVGGVNPPTTWQNGVTIHGIATVVDSIRHR